MIYGFHRGTEGGCDSDTGVKDDGMIIIIVLLCDEKRTLHIERTWRYRINWEMVKKILSIGVPNGLENSMFQLGKIIVLSLVSTFGTYAIAQMRCQMQSHCSRSFREWQLRWQSHRLFPGVWVRAIMNRRSIIIRN